MKKREKDITTEEKIKNAARKLFLQKGYAGTRTRDIAEEAGLNLALLNYYFRSKEMLFNIIIQESMGRFFYDMAHIFNDKDTTLEEKFHKVGQGYVDMLLENPDLPLFILSEIRNPNSTFFDRVNNEVGPLRSRFMEQIEEAMEDQKMERVHKLHIMANFMGLMIFPFVGAPVLKSVLGIENEEFRMLMTERKDLIPKWMMKMFNKE